MKLVERHVIKRYHPAYIEIDQLTFKSKNLYNRANYEIRQHFFSTGEILSYPVMDKRMQTEESYQALPRKVSQQVLRGLDRNWQSWLQATIAYKLEPSKFTGRPKLPKYKDIKGRHFVVYSIQAISRVSLKKGIIAPSMTQVRIPTYCQDIKEVRMVPKLDHYIVEVIYEQTPSQLVDSEHIAAIDVGLNNLAAVTSNQPGFVPVLINGRPLKSINQFYNKKKASLQPRLTENKTSRRIQRLSTARNFKVDDYLHKASRFIVNHLVAHNIGMLVIGKNDLWKQEINIGKANNQGFVQVPHARFIEMLTYKAQLVGMRVIVNEESYTSKASFIDSDEIPVYQSGDNTKYKFSGRRISRGLYKSRSGKLINADINGSFNIAKKAVPNAFGYGIGSCVVQPVKVTLAN